MAGLTGVVIDTADLGQLSRWWARALGWRLSLEAPGQVVVEPPARTPGIMLSFVPAAEAKTAKNRIHLDLATVSDADQVETVARLTAGGATPVAQRGLPWVVLADPEGNELCVLEPRPSEQRTGALASVVVDVEDPGRQARFWSEATGWPVVDAAPGGCRLRAPSGRGPFLDLIPVPEPLRVKNRLRLEVAPLRDESHQQAATKLQAAGARPSPVVQGADAGRTLLVDPEGQEFCLRGRPATDQAGSSQRPRGGGTSSGEKKP